MEKGFSFIQFLFILVTISIVAGVIFVLFDPLGIQRQRRNDQRKQDFVKIQSGLEAYYKQHGKYPLHTDSKAEKPYRIKGFRSDHLIIDWGEEWQPYVAVLPKDPNKNTYVYFATPNGQAYWLYASLENGGNTPISLSANNIQRTTCGGICNYGVSSPNVSP